jgi:carbon monoxide dehydrogenase subunit G
MKDFSISVDVQAPPSAVWSVMSDVERWHEWTTSITSVTRRDPGPLGIGARAHVRQPRLRPADFIVTEFEAGKQFTWVTHSPGLTATARHSVEPIPGGTRARLSVRFDGLMAAPIAWMFGRLTTEYLALEAAGLKERSEQQARA